MTTSSLLIPIPKVHYVPENSGVTCRKIGHKQKVLSEPDFGKTSEHVYLCLSWKGTPERWQFLISGCLVWKILYFSLFSSYIE